MILNEDLFEDAVVIEIPELAAEEITQKEITPQGPMPGEDTGVADLIMDAIKDEYEAIQFYNQLSANLCGHDEMKTVIDDILAEENNHVGQLQKLLQLISPNATEIDSGSQEAEEQLQQGEI